TAALYSHGGNRAEGIGVPGPPVRKKYGLRLINNKCRGGSSARAGRLEALVTEGPNCPPLLSPAPGPSQRKSTQSRSERASRPGLSRIPGRDHRRYYHEYWRSEYLMDFDPRRHGMICMVCGSSLATLKLSTIKRHIRQKHPDSLLWSTADKEVIRSGWESHLGMEGRQRPLEDQCTEDMLDCARRSTGTALGFKDLSMGKPGSGAAKWQSPPDSASVTSPPCSEVRDTPGPPVDTLERYLNDSLHAWFRQEFLMEYEAEAGRLLCMVCGGQLPSLHLDHIKSHVLDAHPNSLVYSAEEKHCILQTWAQRQGECSDKLDPTAEEDDNDDNEEMFPRDAAGVSAGCRRLGENGDQALGEPEASRRGGPRYRPRARIRQDSSARVWRMDYLVAYGADSRGVVCMVCSQALPTTRVGCFRRHIQDCHPETANLSRHERETLVTARLSATCPGGPERGKATAGTPDANDGCFPGGSVKDGPVGRHGHYPGKDQRRNYQVRWRVDYLMDYDCRRHGLICMVCGAGLATLKVSTIKRHIQQVHPHSMEFSAEERQQALLSYNQTALHFVHSDDCFSAGDHGHAALEGLLAS
uniref:Zinc finger translocation associated n=1 Tax=Paramormyrops kingsleyae TaxID=1676925 RepID=A0A3B3T3J0_9TELE